MALSKEQQRELDTAATRAEAEFELLDQRVREATEAWWGKWYEEAGHKRLGRIVLHTFTPKES